MLGEPCRWYPRAKASLTLRQNDASSLPVRSRYRGNPSGGPSISLMCRLSTQDNHRKRPADAGKRTLVQERAPISAFPRLRRFSFSSVFSIRRCAPIEGGANWIWFRQKQPSVRLVRALLPRNDQQADRRPTFVASRRIVSSSTSKIDAEISAISDVPVLTPKGYNHHNRFRATRKTHVRAHRDSRKGRLPTPKTYRSRRVTQQPASDLPLSWDTR